MYSWLRVQIRVGLPSLHLPAVIALAGFASACGLTAFERPQSLTVSSAELSSHDLIAYRELSIDDFLATTPPPVVARHPSRFWAYSCLQLRPRADAPLTITLLDDGSAAPRYSATPKDLHYLAYFDRDCSWWNHAVTQPLTYILQHEQIHFLITELEARRLNRRVAEIASATTSVAATPQAAAAATRLQLRQVMQAAVREVDLQHLAFDKDASNGEHAELQQRWWRRLSVELETDDRGLSKISE